MTDKLERLIWLDGKDGFSVSICFDKILQARLRFFINGVCAANWTKVWLKQILVKNSFLLWLLVRGKALTQEGLRHRGVALASSCIFCRSSVESADHLLCRCLGILSVWNLLYSAFTFWFPTSTRYKRQADPLGVS